MSQPPSQLAYVLHSRPYRETSALVDFITPQGRLRAVLRRCCSEQDHAPESLRLRVVSATTMFWRG